jgi:hypothetical protein
MDDETKAKVDRIEAYLKARYEYLVVEARTNDQQWELAKLVEMFGKEFFKKKG